MSKLNSPKIAIKYVTGVTISYTASNLTHELGRPSEVVNDLFSIDGEQVEKYGKKGFFLSGGAIDETTQEVSGCLMDGTYTFFDSKERYPGVLGTVLSNDDYTFSSEQYITVSKTNSGDVINLIAVYFDSVANEYATNITLSTNPGTIFKNNRTIFTKTFPSSDGVTSIKISFPKWSKKNSLLKLLKVTTSLSGEYDYKTIKSLDFSNEKITNEEEVSFGVTSQYCDVSLIDKNGEIASLHETNLLVDDVTAVIYLVNTEKKPYYDEATGITTIQEVDTETKIGEFYLSSYENEKGTLVWDFSMVDKLEKFKNEKISPEDVASRSLYDIITIILGRMGLSDMVSWEENALSFCKNKMISNSYIEPNQYAYDVLCKCCEVGLLRIFVNPQGYVRVERGL